ncbi:hypothetical protein HanXRQr2_Chr13g0606351 [Helianthus annuus]|uniref:Uncharacterized protein n=1 Tax=Helianthus annuus TaxID=4232 RepID=A0A251SWA2_HELAN|nr:hypothetical protein HanXRQr2_Chr13g0606351 [Helianthus annuus]
MIIRLIQCLLKYGVNCVGVGTQLVGLTSPLVGQETAEALIRVGSHRDTRVDQWDMLSVVPEW